jgi:hypothetical protein
MIRAGIGDLCVSVANHIIGGSRPSFVGFPGFVANLLQQLLQAI